MRSDYCYGDNFFGLFWLFLRTKLWDVLKTGILLPAHIWVDLKPKSARKLENSQNRATCNSTSAAVHLLVSSTQGLCLNPSHQSKEHHVPLRSCACQGSSLALDGVLLTAYCCLLF